MRLVHFSDTHLGYSNYGKIDPESMVNKREEDVYDVFRQIIDYIIRTRPDLAIHAGDLFDSVRPSNRAISVAMEQLSRLSSEGIPTVIIAGNHSTPRLETTESVFRTLQYFPDIHPVFGGRYEKIRIGDCAIHAVPHMYSDENLQESVGKVRADGGAAFNVMVAHTAIRGVSEASWGEFKEQVIPRSALKSDFDYIALGHYHKFQKVRDNAYYCGAPERFRFGEKDNACGFLDVSLDPLVVRHERTNPRGMISLGPIDCSALSASEVAGEFERTVAGRVDGKVVQVLFDKIPRHVRSALDLGRIRQAVSGALHYEAQYSYAAEEDGGAKSSQIGSISEEFEDYVRSQNLGARTADEILSLGRDYLAREEERP